MRVAKTLCPILFLFICSFDTKSDDKISVFLKDYSSSYAIQESSSIFTWTLERYPNFSAKKKACLKSKLPFKNENNQMVYQKIEVAFFEYESESKCKIALDSLLKCFPTECNKLKIGKDVPHLKIIPSLFIINKKSIIVGSVKCDNVNDNWNKFQKDLIKNFSDSTSKKITSECGGPLKWINW